MPVVPEFPKKTPKLLVAIGIALLASACAITPEPVEQPAPEASGEPPLLFRAGLNNPFELVDEAIRRVGSAQPPATEVARIDPPPAEIDLIGRAVDRFSFAHCQDGSRAARWAQWFADRPDYMNRVLDRAHPWLYDILGEIEARDLPGELILLPIIESAYDPFAYSHGRASGAWQFLSGTARDFGIEINDAYDGRRDVYAATRAALDYLNYLGGLFDGDWNLALAAYNAGQGRVQRAMRRNASRGRPTDWASLSLPRETMAYVPKMNGLGCLFQSPERFGLELPVWDNLPSIAKIELDGPVDIVQVSLEADLELGELVVLNAGLNGHLTSPNGPHHLIVPIDRADDVLGSLQSLPELPPMEFREITVRRGDTLSGLAARHQVSLDELRRVNQLNGDLLRVGQTLKLAAPAQVTPPAEHQALYQELASLQQQLLPTRRFQHQVRPGENLWLIARNYQVRVADIQRWNNLGDNSMIRPGQRLMIHMDQGPGAPTAAPSTVSYTVRSGDSLWLIARRHNVRVADLMRWNQLSEGAVLRPGQTLTIQQG